MPLSCPHLYLGRRQLDPRHIFLQLQLSRPENEGDFPGDATTKKTPTSPSSLTRWEIAGLRGGLRITSDR